MGVVLPPTVVALPHTRAHTAAENAGSWSHAPLCGALALCVPLIHGYHPYAEDGGIYLAGIKLCLHPELYQRSTGFVAAHVQFSIFAHAVALLARVYPPALMGILFALYLLAAFLTLFTASMVAKQITADVSAQRWSIVLLATCLTVPVAGTSLMLMDPYVTARSLALPCVLAAFAATLRLYLRHAYRRDVVIVALSLLAAVVLHPLSGGYGAAAVATLLAMGRPTLRARCISMGALVCGAVVACVALRVAWSDVPVGYSAIAQSRSYWALSNWAWYEVAGLVAPLVLLLLISRLRSQTSAGKLFARAMVVAGLLSAAISLVFVHAHGPDFAVASVQPLRMFQYVYLAMPLCIGTWLAVSVKHKAISAFLCMAAALSMFASQRTIYASSNHVEWPWAEPTNAYEQAFLWVRSNTPVDAAVSVDAQYITAHGEDAHNVRAVTERSVPADVSKDGGIAAIRPSLTRDWYDGVALQRGLALLPDSERLERLNPQHIGWMILPHTSSTSFPCPYRNALVSVCHVPTENFVRNAK